MTKEKKILTNYLLYILLFIGICIVGITNVFALEYTDIGYVHTLSGVDGEVTIDVTYETESGAPLVINRNQVIYTQLKAMNVFISNYSFEANRQYQIEMEFPYQQLQFANTYQVFGSNNELCQVNYSASIFNSQWPRWNWSCPHATNEIYLKVYNSNNTAITNYGEWSWNYIYMRYTNSSISSDQQDTDIIINNNNMNTDRIIENNNQNTQDIINSNKVCNFIDKNSIVKDNYYLNSQDVLRPSQYFGVTDYIKIDSTAEIDVVTDLGNSSVYYCFYDVNKTYISCSALNTLSANSKLSIPNNSSYFRSTIYKDSNRPTFNICQNGNQALNDTLTDDSIDTSQATDFFGNFNDNNHGLSGIVSAPLTAINQLLNNQCSPLSATWEGKTVSLPCGYEMWQRFSTFKQFLNVVIDGLLCYRILLKLFKLIEKFKNPNDDRVEVMDL